MHLGQQRKKTLSNNQYHYSYNIEQPKATEDIKDASYKGKRGHTHIFSIKKEMQTFKKFFPPTTNTFTYII